MVDIREISFSYGKEKIIDKLTLKIEENGLYAIMGPSGCGKSTLFYLIAGLLSPAEGTIAVSCKELGFSFQEPRLLPWLTAEDNIKFASRDKKTATQRAISLLSDLSLEDSANKYPSELSGGMQKRVSLARTLINEPDLLLLDEPFSGLDEDNKERIIKSIKEYSKNAIVLLITHDSAEAEAYAKRIFHLDKV